MATMIVAIPLFDKDMTVKAYRLCDHNTAAVLDTKRDFRGKTQEYYLPVLEIINKVGIEPFAVDKPLFVDVSRFHVLTGMHVNTNIPESKLVLTLPANIEVDSKILMGLEGLKDCGYSIALDGYPGEEATSRIMSFLDYIMLDYGDKNFYKNFEAIRKDEPNKQIIVANLPSIESYEKLAKVKQTLFSGTFYKNPITSGNKEISPLKVNALKLMKEINEDDFDLATIASTIERDPALSISLLKFINSPAVGLKSKVSSINNAVALLGQKEVRRWATITISMGISTDKPGEVSKLSLVRAKFAENLAPIFELGVFQNSLFMTGLFSILDIILDKPMEEAINEVAVDRIVKEMLVKGTGSLSRVMNLIYAYERADWNKVSITVMQENINGEQVGDAFIDAIVWYHNLLTAIDEHVSEV